MSRSSAESPGSKQPNHGRIRGVCGRYGERIGPAVRETVNGRGSGGRGPLTLSPLQLGHGGEGVMVYEVMGAPP